MARLMLGCASSCALSYRTCTASPRRSSSRRPNGKPGIRFLTEAGEITDERRQEFILLSDTLGLSMVVDALEDVELGTTTESTVLGPFWADGAPSREYGENMAEHPAGEPAWVHGHVRDVDGQPISGVELDVWQNAENGLYAMQDPDAPEHHLRGRFRTRADGSYGFVTVRPAPYEVPTDGPVGRMLHANDRAAWRPGHIHIIVTCEGFERLVTHIFDADPVFCVKPSLLRTFVARRADDPEKPAGVEGAWHSVAKRPRAPARTLRIGSRPCRQRQELTLPHSSPKGRPTSGRSDTHASPS